MAVGGLTCEQAERTIAEHLKKIATASDTDVELANAAATLARREYQQAVDANKVVPNTVPPTDVQKRFECWTARQLDVVKTMDRVHPKAQVTLGRRGEAWREAVLPKPPYKIGIFDFLQVSANGTLLDQPINNYFWVEPTGTVALGPVYGRVEVKGLTLEEAQAAIETKLKQILTQPTVQVTLFRQKDQKESWRRTTPPQPPYTIKPGMLLSINVRGTLMDQPIEDTYTVEATGTVALGPAYGRVQVNGLSLEAAEKAVQKKLEEILRKPEVQVSFAGWQRENDPLMAAVVARRTAAAATEV